MGRKSGARLPALVRHSSGRARVRIEGVDLYLGKWGTPEAEERYRRTIAEYLATGEVPRPQLAAPLGLTIGELLQRYKRHCESYYRHPDGREMTELASIRAAMRPLRELFSLLSCHEFGPTKLIAVRDELIRRGQARRNVNGNIAYSNSVAAVRPDSIGNYGRTITSGNKRQGNGPHKGLTRCRPLTSTFALLRPQCE